MKITASRLSEGNKIFPAEIHIEPTGISVKIPGFFSGESKYFDFYNIASVDINAPMIGYSTITFYAGGTKMIAHGFNRSEVQEVKDAIERGKSNYKEKITYSSPSTSKSPQVSEQEGNNVKQSEKTEDDLIKDAKKVIEFIGRIISSGARKKAFILHQDLIKITDDVDIAIISNNMEEALVNIRLLQHTSTHKIPDSETNYVDYWNAKRKEYISNVQLRPMD